MDNIIHWLGKSAHKDYPLYHGRKYCDPNLFDVGLRVFQHPLVHHNASCFQCTGDSVKASYFHSATCATARCEYLVSARQMIEKIGHREEKRSRCVKGKNAHESKNERMKVQPRFELRTDSEHLNVSEASYH